ncbi:hypothetical protein HDV05_007954 [Chytridiales sp. JEL 0842]|nr:hypothetical protein HDV05_007954 [Chytridiales sp. JEL 0842]
MIIKYLWELTCFKDGMPYEADTIVASLILYCLSRGSFGMTILKPKKVYVHPLIDYPIFYSPLFILMGLLWRYLTDMTWRTFYAFGVPLSAVWSFQNIFYVTYDKDVPMRENVKRGFFLMRMQNVSPAMKTLSQSLSANDTTAHLAAIRTKTKMAIGYRCLIGTVEYFTLFRTPNILSFAAALCLTMAVECLGKVYWNVKFVREYRKYQQSFVAPEMMDSTTCSPDAAVDTDTEVVGKSKSFTAKGAEGEDTLGAFESKSPSLLNRSVNAEMNYTDSYADREIRPKLTGYLQKPAATQESIVEVSNENLLNLEQPQTEKSITFLQDKETVTSKPTTASGGKTVMKSAITLNVTDSDPSLKRNTTMQSPSSTHLNAPQRTASKSSSSALSVTTHLTTPTRTPGTLLTAVKTISHHLKSNNFSQMEAYLDPRYVYGLKTWSFIVADASSLLMSASIALILTSTPLWASCVNRTGVQETGLRFLFAVGLFTVTEGVAMAREQVYVGYNLRILVGTLEKVKWGLTTYFCFGYMMSAGLAVILAVEAGLYSRNVCFAEGRI